MHENLFVNQPLLQAMDLHNNKVGMELFMELLQGIHRQFFETLFFTDRLYELSQKAKLISTEKEIIDNLLVITEDID